MRAKLGLWKQDKYVLALTASNPESNCMLEDNQANQEGNLGADNAFEEQKGGMHAGMTNYIGGQLESKQFNDNGDEQFGGNKL